MKSAYCLFFTILIACESEDVSNSHIQSSTCIKVQPNRFTPLMYSKLKNAVHAQQLQYRALKSPGLARAYIYSTITDSIFAYWYGTPWDYNGITQVPNEGKIACGYFVTTVLRDAGLPVARIKLAQAPASTLINTVCAPKSIRRFGRLQDLKAYLNTIPDATLLILGLDNHVGFVQHSKEHDFFIDAGYAGDQVVMKELLDDAIPVKSSGSFMIGDLLANEAIIKRWIAAK